MTIGYVDLIIDIIPVEPVWDSSSSSLTYPPVSRTIGSVDVLVVGSLILDGVVNALSEEGDSCSSPSSITRDNHNRNCN